MRVLGHVAITVTAGTILYNYANSIYSLLSFLVAGILIDLDHYIDYVREYGMTFDIKKVHHACKYENTNFKKTTFILHSYELIALFWLAIIIFNLSIIWKYCAIGLTLHLFIDQVTNPTWPLAYFFLFRLLNNFDTKKILINKEVYYAHRRR